MENSKYGMKGKIKKWKKVGKEKNEWRKREKAN